MWSISQVDGESLILLVELEMPALPLSHVGLGDRNKAGQQGSWKVQHSPGLPQTPSGITFGSHVCPP